MFKTILSSLDKKKSPSEAEINKIPSYVFCRWLQNHPSTIMAANQINLYYNIPMVNQYNIIKQSFGAKRGLYIQYPKSTKDETYVDEVLARHFQINLTKAKEYKRIIGDVEVQKIIALDDERKGLN